MDTTFLSFCTNSTNLLDHKRPEFEKKESGDFSVKSPSHLCIGINKYL